MKRSEAKLRDWAIEAPRAYASVSQVSEASARRLRGMQ